MTSIAGIGRTLILSIGLVAAAASEARCDDPVDTNRDNIVQGVREDVRRQIKQRDADSATVQSVPRNTRQLRKKRKPSVR
jgi:hypothetical protein